MNNSLAILAQDDRQAMFLLNLRLIIGGLICGGMLLVIAFGAWTAIRAWRFAQQQKRLDAARGQAPGAGGPGAAAPEQMRGWADAEAGESVDHGICDQCGRLHRRVFVMPDGRRLCSYCRQVDSG